jgi:hypothetical protein
MKIMEIKNKYCFSDLTPVAFRHDLSKINGLHYVETPDYVFPGWGYDETAEGDDRFVKPTAPEGWIYDEMGGSFHRKMPAYTETQLIQQDITDLQIADIEQQQEITELELMVLEAQA